MANRFVTYLGGATLLAVSACAAPVADTALAPAPASQPAVGAATITSEDVFGRVSFLASEALRGRDTPSEGLDAAAAYLVSEHIRFGLEPAGENGTYYQYFPFGLRRLNVEAAQLSFTGVADAGELVHGRDYYATQAARSGLNAGLVYVGAEIDASSPTLRQSVAVAALPMPSPTREFRILGNQQAQRAHEAGAAGIIHILAPEWTADQIGAMASSSGQPRRTLGDAAPFPQLFLSYEAASRIFSAADLDLNALWAQASSGAVDPVALSGVSVNAQLPEERLDEAMAPNVVAVLPGSDPELRDEYVILSAHMDHVGVGRPVNGDSVYNGADDNASGTAGLIEIAEALSTLPEAPRRSIVFLHVSAEEKGLLGSRWYSDNPTLPLENIVANINVDMIGRNAPDSVVVIGKDYSSLGEVVNRVGARHPELGLVPSDDIWPEERFFFRSDHFNFARKEVPAIFFFTGVHEDYHQPSDHVEKLDTDKAARVAQLIYHVAIEIANDPQRPVWDPEGLEEVRSLTR